ncbi:hypothetical protein EV421DRAFT_486960 [Armillaria borealis]|uniref:Uncharacterized protein n=1 Tax=Armillaria borealis TaxID=47425 RepID=A0AA39JLQ9_9AGAR|nr:hypothetical protein EV421DRAFT_486960 [Armillaria borealis]
MGDNQSFLVGRQPFLFKIKGGPKPPDLVVTNDDLVRLAEVYTRGPDSAQEATWRKYRHCKELSDIMVCWMTSIVDREVLNQGLLRLQDVLVPKIQHFSKPPYGMYSVNGSLENWRTLRDSAKNWKKKEGPGSLTQLRKAAVAEEEEDGQPYVSDGSQDNALEREGHAEDPIIISDQSSSSGEEDRRRHRASRPFGQDDLVTRPPNDNNGAGWGKTRAKEQQLMSQPKQLLSPSCGKCAKARLECYVGDERIRRLNNPNHGRMLLRCIRCTARQLVCSLNKKENLLEKLVQRLENPGQPRLDASSSFLSVALT